MKKLFLLLLATVSTATLSAQHYVVTGKAPVGTKMVYLIPIGEEPIDSIQIDAAGTFTFRGEAAGKHLAYVATKGEKAKHLVVFLEGEPYVNLEEETVAGSEENRGLSDYQTFVNTTLQPLKTLAEQLTDKRNNGELTEQELAYFYNLSDSLTTIINARAKQDLKYNTRMRWPAYIVLNQLNDFDHDFLISLDTPVNAFMQEPCLGRAKKLIDAYKRTQVGQHFADFEMADTAGVMHHLSEYVGCGRYVLLDFWATWCGPCMGELPNVKALYDKYHDKGFEIVGISFDQDGDAWRGVIQRRNMNWTHLSDLSGWKSLPVEFYGVNAIPHLMLIGPDGTIIANDISTETLSERLKEIYQ